MGQALVSQDVIRQVKDRIDIVDVVSGYLALSKAGQNFKGLCPFHVEKTPSFMVSPSRQVFHCFGCGAGGDVFAFVMRRENLGFLEAVQELGRRAGVAVTLRGPSSGAQDQARKDLIVKINESAGKWFTENLWEPRVGKKARDYLASRGISDETAREFGLGFAPASWDGLMQVLSRQGFSLADVEAAGLIVSKDRPDSRRKGEAASYYDRFRGRLMFPIRDLRRQVIAFGGRVLDEGLPKYLNSPESARFKKGTALFGLERAREGAWQAQSLVVVEGYFDAVALHQAGLTNVVATLGTALTSDHVKTLRRFSTKISLIFDPDAAGVQAAIRTLDVFRDSGMSVRVVSLPEKDDPDTFVRREGVEAFTQLEASAPSLVEFAVEHSMRKAVTGGIDDRIRSVDEILRILQKTENRIEKEECLRRVAERLGISQRVLVERYPALVAKDRQRGERSREKEGPEERSPVGRREERELLQFMLKGQLTVAQVRALECEAFSVAAFRQIVESAQRHLNEKGSLMGQEVLDELLADPDCGPIATELVLAEGHYEDLERYIEGCLQAFHRRRHDVRLTDLIAKLRAAEQEGLVDEVHRLNALVNELRMEKAIGPSPSA